MLAARLHGLRDVRVEEVESPVPLAPAGYVLLRVRAVGICGSDLHAYQDRDTARLARETPLILGHEFCGLVVQAGSDALGGDHQPLWPGQRVAVDPAQSCGRCRLCELGHPNLCENLRFCGLHPYDGAMCEWMHVPARNCFGLPAEISDAGGALLETLGVAIHAVDLGKIRPGDRVAVLGAGPIGLCILQVARAAGATSGFASDRLSWRLELADRFGATLVNYDQEDAVQRILELTDGRGVDVAIEAAWAGEAAQQAADVCRPGGRVVLVGIPREDQLLLTHSVARRKGLTISMCRRMKHTYPRALRLVERGAVNLEALVSHHFSLRQAAEAFELNAEYREGVVKVIIDVEQE